MPSGQRTLGLAALLRRQRKCWLKALKRCQETFSEESVHEVRSQGRRLMSVLSLVRVALPAEAFESIEARVKAGIKCFAQLRDLHVELGLMGDLARERPEALALLRYLAHRERRLTKRLRRELDQAETRKLTVALTRLEHQIEAAESDPDWAAGQPARLIATIGAAFRKVQALQRRVNPRDTATIHRVRVAFKRFRYMVETLADALPGVTRTRLKAMQTYQTRMGEIQDLDVLRGRIAKFAAKHPEEEGGMRRLEAEVLQRRSELIRCYFSHRDDLRDFWPLSGQPSAVADGKRSPSHGPLSTHVRHGRHAHHHRHRPRTGAAVGLPLPVPNR